MNQNRKWFGRYGKISLVTFLLFICFVLTVCSGDSLLTGGLIEAEAKAPTQSITEVPSIASASSTKTEANQQDAEETELTVYFIDVGQADAALLVCCHGDTMLIDGGNAADSNLIYTFLRNKGIKHLDYIVASHAHEDHVGGLAGALNLVDSVGVAYSPATSYDTRAFESFVKYLDKHGVSITVPTHGDTFKFGAAEVEILGPIGDTYNTNNTSIVMRITHGDVAFLFTGDAERELEQEILAEEYDLSATVLKVGHHGSDSSTTYPYLREIMPEFAVISVGRNNQYGHPHENLLSRLRDADVKLYRTDMQGDITAVSDGKTVSFTVERNADAETNPTAPTPSPKPTVSPTPAPATQPTADSYIGNKNTLKFHLPTCRTLPAEKNRVYFKTRQAAVSAGYDPCGNCKP